ncbi:hypothetical protein EQW78_00195 [Oerskovia turbata]|uniref:Uncharacterized protein n=1 Tax=Oerskovia turbata TaxID=1713 RepID=A0A4Q1L2S9_9CELL|nr:hypothetical protein [Oerskovia turbata]RXR26122.1 hypothetical protein EQW73_07140 [Oerskovia turbata]RXR36624.1 hypothetical protein EQW78_00195 [Oerskovia turbata]TGJ97325.1 hypothetical protein DLJ96_04865 [Actinotalea fermentans ATCC 43279 = JCM 9966 = DSM 3133]
MSRAVAVPVVDRSAALIVAGLAGLVTALILFCASLAVGLGGSDYASFYGATPGDAVAAAALAAVSGLGALCGAVAFLLGACRAVANMDRYLAFRVAILPRRVEPPTPGEAGPEVSPAGIERASGAMR